MGPPACQAAPADCSRTPGSALARTLADSRDRGWALHGLAIAIARTGDLDRAEALARTITDPRDRGWALNGLVTGIAAADNPDRAEALARTITQPDYQAEARPRFSAAGARLPAAGTVTNLRDQAGTLTELAARDVRHCGRVPDAC